MNRDGWRPPLALRVFAECVVLLAVVGLVAGWFTTEHHSTPAAAPTAPSTAPITSTTLPSLGSSLVPVTASSTTPTTINAGPEALEPWTIASGNPTELHLTVTVKIRPDNFGKASKCNAELQALVKPGATVLTDALVHHDPVAGAAPTDVQPVNDKDLVRMTKEKCLMRTLDGARLSTSLLWSVSEMPSSFQVDSLLALTRKLDIHVNWARIPKCASLSNRTIWLKRDVSNGATIDPATLLITPDEKNGSGNQTLAAVCPS